jgi:malate dehydrogenase (oxaloacetate-decarboxylating)(NADP+)
MAMLSYSNFGSRKEDVAMRTSQAVRILHDQYPEMCIDGEMQVTYALNRELRDEVYPFSKLYGRDVNTLIFPNLSSANIAYKFMLEMGLTDAIGPIQIGLKKPIHFISVASPVRDIMNLATVAALDAIVLNKCCQCNNQQQ